MLEKSALETLYGDQFTPSTYLINPKYLLKWARLLKHKIFCWSQKKKMKQKKKAK